MGYASDFIANTNAARDLLTEVGFSSESAIRAVTMIAELCIFEGIIEKIAIEHKRGEQLPSHFEVDLTLNPIHLRGSTRIDLVEMLVNDNVLVPRSGRYRVMLSSLMNRVFTMCADDGNGSIRAEISKISNPGPIEKVLDLVEWEIITKTHENVDMKYFNTLDLETSQIPELLVFSVRDCKVLLESLKEEGIDIEASPSLILPQLKNGPQVEQRKKRLFDYYNAILKLSEVLTDEGKNQWNVIREATAYPRSFLNRSEPPLMKSAWTLNPDFRLHPLIRKFQELIKNNHEKIAQMADLYEDYIRDSVKDIQKFPKGTELITLISEDIDGLPKREQLEAAWTQIGKQAGGLNAQAKLFESLVSSMDSLFIELTKSE